MGGQAQVLISRQTRELTSEIEQLPVYHTSRAGERLNLLIKNTLQWIPRQLQFFPFVSACEVQGNNIFAESISQSFDQTSSLDYVTMLTIFFIITSKQTESQHIFGKQDHLR